jgi:hypothetical protein
VRRTVATLLAGAALIVALPSAVLAVPTPAQTAKSLAAKPKKKLVEEAAGPAETLRAGTLGSFTPSMVDKSRSPALARTATNERSFRFTPSGKIGDRKALTLGLTSRTVVAPRDRATQTASVDVTQGYSVGASVGYYGFSLSGGFSRLENSFGPSREGVDLGLSYRGGRWKASLQASGEQPGRLALDSLAIDKRYAVELGGAYSLNSRLSLSGGMRYQLVTPLDPSLRNDERADPSVFVGTAFSF